MSPGSGDDVDPIREVNRLHLMLQDWYGGVRDDVDPIENALAGDFLSITPDGRLLDREGSIAAWRDRRRAYGDSRPPVRVELEDVTVARTIYGVHQVTYRKRLRVDGDERVYQCSLWLRETERVNTGLQWLHLSETRVEPDEADEATASSEGG